MKTKTPKKPAAKPAKIPKPTPAPRIVRHEPEPERAEMAAARAIVQAVDEAEARAMLAGGPRPFALPPVPADFAAAVRPLLAAARLPAGSLPAAVGRFAALVEEWERTSGPVAWEAWRELCRREFGRDWDAYRRAELARVSARVTADALRAFRRLSPDAARAAAEEARPRFADAGAAVLEYLAAPLPGMDADEDTASPRVFLSRIEDALAALADAARNPATPPASPSNAADVETVARIEAKVDELAARKRKASKRAREAGAAGGKESARQRADGERKRIRAAALGRMRRGIADGKSMKQAARDALRKGEPLLKSNGEPLREDSLVRYFKAAKSKGGA